MSSVCNCENPTNQYIPCSVCPWAPLRANSPVYTLTILSSVGSAIGLETRKLQEARARVLAPRPK